MKHCMVTTSWDDGHKLDIRLAKLLKKHGIKGTLYVSPRDHEFPLKELLTDSQIKQLSHDFEIGGHTITHAVLTKIPLSEAKSEIEESKLYLEKITGKRINSFCYPCGNYNRQLEKAVREAGFKCSRTVQRHKTKHGEDPFATPTTIHCYRHLSDVLLILKAARYNPILFIRYYLDWEPLAKHLFDECLRNGGVFHLWGHSWEIDKNRDWARLARVLAYISRRPGVKYVTNSEVWEVRA